MKLSPDWNPVVLLLDCEFIAAGIDDKTGHLLWVPLTFGFLVEEWRGHKPGALVMSLPTGCGAKVADGDTYFTWMVEVI